MSMKAAVIYPTFVNDLVEGVSKNVHHLSEALAERGLDIVDASPRVDVDGLNRKSVYVRQGIAAYKRVLSSLRDPSVDVVHYHVSIPGMAAWAALARARAGPSADKPLVLHMWNPWFDKRDAHVGGGRERFYQRMFNAPATTIPFLGAFDTLVVSSEYQRAQLLARTNLDADKLHVIPNGVDLDSYHPAPRASTRVNARRELGLPVDRTLLLYYGHLTPWKGVRVLTEALPEALAADPNADLVIARTHYGKDERAILTRLRQLGLARRVHFLGLCDVPVLLQAVDAGVVPATAAVGTACHPNVVLEYQSAGVPIAASRVGSIPEAVEDGRTGLLATPGDAKDLGAKLHTLLAEPSTRAQYARAGRARAEARFDWRAIAGTYERAFEDALARKTRVRSTKRDAPGAVRARAARLF